MLGNKTQATPRFSEWAPVVAFAVVTGASFVNGLPFWLKRVGWLDLPACEVCERKTTRALHRIEEEKSRFERKRLVRQARYWDAFKYFRVTGAERYAKLAKDFAVLVLLATGFVFGIRFGLGVKQWDWLFAAFLMVTALALLYSISRYDWPVVAAGMRAFVFLPIMLLGYQMTSDAHWALIARMFWYLLIVQVPLACMELWVPELLFTGGAFFGAIPGRAVGTFVHPSALGVFAVVTLALYTRFVSATTAMTNFVTITAALIVALSGSGTAMVLLVAALVWILSERVESDTVRVTLYLALISGVVVSLPWLTGRPEIFGSLAGRLWALGGLLASPTGIWEFMMGHGLGIGTNTLITLTRLGVVDFQAISFPPALLSATDSTPLTLMAQVGLLGLVLFYCLCFRAVHEDARVRPLLLTVLVASTMINVLEYYPVNVMLGLALARGICGRKPVAGTLDKGPGAVER